MFSRLPSSMRTTSDLAQFYHSDDDKTGQTICCDYLLLNEMSAPQSENLIVFADEIQINGIASMPGKNIFLHARKVSSIAGGLIDTSGDSGKTWAPGYTAPNGSNGGADGYAGSNGGDGQDAGQIQIFAASFDGVLKIRANGGDGGRGQDGGNGQRGGNGANGTSGYPGTPGAPGQDGGNGGAGGKGGNGGAAGKISIGIILTTGTIDLEGLGGKGGVPGASGIGALGGVGGNGGDNYQDNNPPPGHGPPHLGQEGLVEQLSKASTSTQKFVQLLSPPQITGHQPNGQNGRQGVSHAAGPAGVQGVSPYVKGTTADYSSAFPAVTGQELASRAMLPQLRLLFHQAELDYLRGRFDRLGERVNWFLLMSKSLPTQAVSPFEGKPETADVEGWQNLKSRVDVIKSQLCAGLDFYGFAYNFVPSMTYEACSSFVERMLSTAEKVENSVDVYADKTKENNIRLAAIDDAIKAANDHLNSLEVEKQEHEDSERDVQAAIDALSAEITSQQDVLQSSADSFRKAVEQQTGGICAFLEIIKAVAEIIAVAYGQVELVSDLAHEVSEIPGSQVKDIISHIEKAKDDVGSIQNAYNKIKSDVEAAANSAKIVMAREDLDQLLEPYLNLKEAQDYRAQLTLYDKIVQARNNKVLELTSVMAKVDQLDGQIGQTVAQARKSADERARSQNPELLAFYEFLNALDADVKAWSVRALYQLNRAAEYGVLRLRDFRDFKLEGNDSASLRGEQAAIDYFHERAVEDQSGSEKPLPVVALTLKHNEYAAAFAQLQHSLADVGAAHFSFALSPYDANFKPHSYSTIKITDVSIAVRGVKTNDKKLTITLIQGGYSEFVNKSGEHLVFAHKLRSAVTTYDYEKAPAQLQMGGDMVYINVSPFGVWTIVLNKEDNPGLDVSGVTEITVEFSGTCLPLTVPSSRALSAAN
jgi:hypothetical protein